MAKKKLYDESGNEVKGAKVKKPFYKKVWFWALAVIILVAIGGSLGNEDVANNDTEATNTATTNTEGGSDEATAEEEETEKAYNISDEVNVGDVTYVVTGVETANNVGGEYGQNSKGTYLIVDLSVTNNGSEALTVSDDFFTLINDDKEYKADASAGIYANKDGSFFLESINPDLTMNGKVVFDVSDTVIESDTKQLEVATGFWSTETEIINLQ